MPRRKTIEVLFDRDISHFARDHWDTLDDALNQLLGQSVSWDYGSGCSAITSLKPGASLNGLKRGAKVGRFFVDEVKVLN